MTDYLTGLSEEIEGAESAFERHLIDWCIENIVPFSQLDLGDVYLAFYENIWANPRGELNKIYEFLNQPFDESVTRRLDRVSASTTKDRKVNPARQKTRRLDSWRTQLSADELCFAERAIQKFGLEQIYGSSSLANISNAESLLNKPRLGHDPKIVF